MKQLHFLLDFAYLISLYIFPGVQSASALADNDAVL